MFTPTYFGCAYIKNTFYLTHGKIYPHHLINHLTIRTSDILGKFCIQFYTIKLLYQRKKQMEMDFRQNASLTIKFIRANLKPFNNFFDNNDNGSVLWHVPVAERVW